VKGLDKHLAINGDQKPEQPSKKNGTFGWLERRQVGQEAPNTEGSRFIAEPRHH
jgi:hypothetical protein